MIQANTYKRVTRAESRRDMKGEPADTVCQAVRIYGLPAARHCR